MALALVWAKLGGMSGEDVEGGEADPGNLRVRMRMKDAMRTRHVYQYNTMIQLMQNIRA